ncbi:MAG: hypothetical protein APR54_07925 [Candidatus Cloacimonas sp. SDB]|nr:MAG: hypothetical protein APR54_07925 [Candidatus Cloacimonas sp. SDB]
MKIKLFIVLLSIIITFQSIICYPYLYDRSAVIDYIDLCWDEYNDSYQNFAGSGGDCANFVTQCLIAGGRDIYDPHLHNVLTHPVYMPTLSHTRIYLIPFLEKIGVKQIGDTANLQVGDLIFWKSGNRFPHTAIIVEISDSIYYAAHTKDYRRKGLANPLSQNYHYFRILDGYIFFPNWNSQGVGYYYYIFNWIGPHLYEDISAAGINPQNGCEYRGFNQFTVSGIPSNSNIVYTYLRFTVNSCWGSGNLGLNINHITNTDIPTPYECAAPPFYLHEEEISVSAGDTLWFDLSNTDAPSHIMEANNGSNMFGIGLSENNADLLMLYFFNGNYSNSNERPKIKIFIDNFNENITEHYSTTSTNKTGQDLIEPFLNVSEKLIRNGTVIEFYSGNDVNVQLQIYDVGGRLIRNWIYSRINNNKIYWNCQDNFGQTCPIGVYFVKLYTSTEILTQKIEIIE